MILYYANCFLAGVNLAQYAIYGEPLSLVASLFCAACAALTLVASKGVDK